MATQDPDMSGATYVDPTILPATPATSNHGTTRTSTPVIAHHSNTNAQHGNFVNELNVSPLHLGSEGSTVQESDSISVMSMSISTESEHEVLVPGHIAVPILGYEVVEEHARYSVFKIQVNRGPYEQYFIFRRYSDFDHLNTKLKEYFPHFRLALPPKKWFGDNFDRNFLEDRMLGLQAFLNNLVGNRDVCNSEPVREFFCFDDPPGPHDSLEESRALCESLEERVFSLHQQVSERDGRIQILEDELRLNQIQVENLRKALKLERAAGRRNSILSLPPTEEVDEHEDALPSSDNAKNGTMLPRPSTSNQSGSIGLDSSLKAIETIRMATIPPQPDTDLPSIDHNAQPDVIPCVMKHPDNSTLSSHPESTSHSSVKSSNQMSSGYASLKSSHQDDVNHSLDGSMSEQCLSDSGSDMTGPGKLCTASSNKLSVLSDRVSTSSSPQPKHQMLSAEQETISPGAHSVDSSSRKRAVGKLDTGSGKVKGAIGVAHTKDIREMTLEQKAQNNNETLLT